MITDDELNKTISQLPTQPSGDKIMQAVVMTTGPGTRLLELTRSGPARKGIKTWVENEPVVWLTNDRSAMMPVSPGQLTATYEVSGTAGQGWRIRTTKPSSATGGDSGTVPPAGKVIGQFLIVVP